jgi:hypothetical protein
MRPPARRSRAARFALKIRSTQERLLHAVRLQLQIVVAVLRRVASLCDSTRVLDGTLCGRRVPDRHPSTVGPSHRRRAAASVHDRTPIVIHDNLHCTESPGLYRDGFASCDVRLRLAEESCFAVLLLDLNGSEGRADWQIVEGEKVRREDGDAARAGRSQIPAATVSRVTSEVGPEVDIRRSVLFNHPVGTKK